MCYPYGTWNKVRQQDVMIPFTQNTAIATNGRALQSYVAGLGVDIVPLAKAVNIDPSMFESEHDRISLDSFGSLLDILATVTSDDCFGLNYARAYQLGDVGPFGFLLVNSPTVRVALENYQKFQDLVADSSSFSFGFENGRIGVEWQFDGIISKPTHYVDFTVKLFCKMMKQIAGANWKPDVVSLVRRPPRSIQLHERLLVRGVRFNSRKNLMVFQAAVLDSQIGQADSRLYRIMLDLCEEDLLKIQANKDVIQVVKDRIREILPTRTVALVSVAKTLGIGERTLQRRLAQYDVTFEQLVESTRHELSDRLLSTTDMPLSQIAYSCGYSSPSAYSRAARAWYGTTPARYRKLKQVAPT